MLVHPFKMDICHVQISGLVREQLELLKLVLTEDGNEEMRPDLEDDLSCPEAVLECEE